MIDELPWAMLPNGPAWTMTGVFSSVCSRFGFSASRMMTAIEPAPFSCSAVTGSPARVVADDDPAEAGAQVLQPTSTAPRWPSPRDAAVMSKPVWRGTPSALPPRPTMMLRSARSLTSSTRRQVMLWMSRSELVALVQMVVDHRRQQVVGRRDRVEVAGQVQVEQLHRDHLAVAAAGRAALDAEGRAHRRLAQADGRLLADVLHRHAEPDRGRRLALAERRRGDRGDDDVLGLRSVGELVDRLQPDLGRAHRRAPRAGAGPMPIWAAISVSGASVPARAMSRSDGKATG